MPRRRYCAGALNLKRADRRIFGRRVATRRGAPVQAEFDASLNLRTGRRASVTTVRKRSLPVVLLIRINFGLPPRGFSATACA